MKETEMNEARYANKAERYREAAYHVTNDGVLPSWFPKYIPRGRPAAWYDQKAEEYEAKAEKAQEMTKLLAQLTPGPIDALPPNQRPFVIQGRLGTVETVLCVATELVDELWADLGAVERVEHADQIKDLVDDFVVRVSEILHRVEEERR
jgi:hypothetical protein